MEKPIEFHKQFILKEELWPRAPLLPLTRKDADRSLGKELGVITESDKTLVYLTNYLIFPKTHFELNRIPSIMYDSVDAMLADGWNVD